MGKMKYLNTRFPGSLEAKHKGDKILSILIIIFIKLEFF